MKNRMKSIYIYIYSSLTAVVFTSLALAALLLPTPALAEAQNSFEDSNISTELGQDISRTLTTTLHKVRTSITQIGRDATKFFDSSALGSESANTEGNEAVTFNNVSDTPGIEWNDDGTVCTITGNVTRDDLSQELWDHSVVQIVQTNSGSGISGDCSYLFAGLPNLQLVDLSQATLSPDTIESMFADCMELRDISLPNSIDMSKITSMDRMFSNCSSLQNIAFPDVFNTSQVTSMNAMFSNCSSLQGIALPDTFNTSEVTDMTEMFSGCSVLQQLSLPNAFNTSQVENIPRFLINCEKLETLDLPASFASTKVADMSSMFENCSSLKELTIPSSFDALGATDMRSLFKGCKNLETLNLPDTFSTGKTTSLSSMFEDCTSLKVIELPDSFNTSKVENMSSMFKNCSSLETLHLSEGFVTDNVSYVNDMFFGCSQLESLNLSSFTPSSKKVKESRFMFADCDNLKELNLGGFALPEDAPDFDENFTNCVFARLGQESAEGAYLILGSLQNLNKITLTSSCVLTPGEGIETATAKGMFFDYKEPLSWSAYYQGNTSNADEGTPDAILTGFEEFKAYQESHPGITTFVLNTSPVPPGPTPGPTPDPEPQPQPSSEDSTAANNNALAKTGDMLAIVSALTGAAILSGLGLLGFSRKNAYRK